MKTRMPLLLILLASLAGASAIKVWSTGDVLSTTDLNANFSHIHGTMVGGHGARLKDADVSATALIAHSKLATPMLVPRAVGGTSSECSVLADGGVATCNELSGINYGYSTITTDSTGHYIITWSPARTDTSYVMMLTSVTSSAIAVCRVTSTTTVNATLQCNVPSTLSVASSNFDFIMMDDN